MMSRLIRRVLVISRSWVFGAALVALAISAAPVLAVGPGGGPGPKSGGSGKGSGGGGGGGNVPEINPNAAVAALTLVGGMTLILSDRLRRRQAAEA